MSVDGLGDLSLEVKVLNFEELKEYVVSRAETIVRETQGDSWDDTGEWIVDAVELAHGVAAMFRGGFL